MQRANYIELQGVLSKVRGSGITVTPVAANLIYDMIDAVTRDPHPSWAAKLTPNGYDGFQRSMIEKMSDELMRFPSAVKSQRITTFDLLHHVSSIVDRLCPFEKVPA